MEEELVPFLSGRKRKVRKQYSLLYRYLGMRPNELYRERNLKKWFRNLILLDAIVDDRSDEAEIEEILEILFMNILHLTTERRVPRMDIVRLNRTIESFNVQELDNGCRCRSHEDMRRLLHALELPDRCTLRNRSTCTGEELLLIGMWRLCSREDLYDLVKTFGRDITWLSRAFNYFVHFITTRHGWRLFDNLQFWVPHFGRFAEAIRIRVLNKAERIGRAGELDIQPGSFKIAGFMDCHNQYIGTVGAGPAANGQNQQRQDPHGWQQRLFYNGWLADHGLKYGTVDAPCGMMMYASYGTSSRESDLSWLADSNINQMLIDAQNSLGIMNNLYQIYGDSIFPWLECVLSRYSGENLPPVRDLENKCMSSCRESIEWHYGEMNALFPFVDVQKKNFLLLSPVRETFVTAMLLRNCLVSMYGNNTSNAFNCPPPTLEEYFSEQR